MLRMEEMGHFWAQNQHFLNFAPNMIIRFFWNDMRWNASKTEQKFLFWILKENAYYASNGLIGQVLELRVHCYFVLIFITI